MYCRTTLHRLYRAPLDLVEQLTTGAAHQVGVGLRGQPLGCLRYSLGPTCCMALRPPSSCRFLYFLSF